MALDKNNQFVKMFLYIETNRVKMSELKALSKIINDLKSPAEVHSFLTEILT
ncbi:MAG: hypothetical protein MJ229_06710 [bacterium]|nr:hypothetical protein [bacterium]